MTWNAVDRGGARARSGAGWRGFVLGLVVAALLGAALAPLAAPLVLSHKETLPFEAQLGRLAKNWSVPADVRGRTNPLAGDPAAVTEGRRLYSISCVACHGTTGQGNGPIGRNLYPPPSNLTSDEVRRLTDGELFWFISNGISFVGMPSYGITTTTATATYTEQQIWQLVAQVRALQSGPAAAPAASPAASPGASPAAAPAASPRVTPTP